MLWILPISIKKGELGSECLSSPSPVMVFEASIKCFHMGVTTGLNARSLTHCRPLGTQDEARLFSSSSDSAQFSFCAERFTTRPSFHLRRTEKFCFQKKRSSPFMAVVSTWTSWVSIYKVKVVFFFLSWFQIKSTAGESKFNFKQKMHPGWK